MSTGGVHGGAGNMTGAHGDAGNTASAQREPIVLQGPLNKDDVSRLRAGDVIRFSGTVYTARDAAHKRMCETLDKGKALPIDICGAVVYYAGPAPAPPGKPTGPVGPTSSYRMDAYTPQLLDCGMLGMIGKGRRSQKVRDAIVRNHAVYFAAIGGAAALIGRCVRSAQVVAYDDLGTEAIRRLEVVDMPLTVAIDAFGADLYDLGPEQYLRSAARRSNPPRE